MLPHGRTSCPGIRDAVLHEARRRHACARVVVRPLDESAIVVALPASTLRYRRHVNRSDVPALPGSSVALVDGIAFGCHGDFSALVYNVPPRQERMTRLYDLCDAYLARLGGTTLTLQVVLPRSTAPDAAARAETRKRLAIIDPQVRRSSADGTSPSTRRRARPSRSATTSSRSKLAEPELAESRAPSR